MQNIPRRLTSNFYLSIQSQKFSRTVDKLVLGALSEDSIIFCQIYRVVRDLLVLKNEFVENTRLLQVKKKL